MDGPRGAPGRGARARLLLRDGALGLRVQPGLGALAAAWCPLLPPAAPGPRPAALVRLSRGAPPAPVPDGPPTVEVLGMRGWVAGDGALLAGENGRVGGRVDLAGLRADLRVRPGETPGDRADVFCALTIAAALLLARQGRVLLHAAAVVPPGGGAWLLAGDSHSGKSSSCVSLIRGGWGYLSDDHVVVWADPRTGALRVEGWRRRFNLDDGFGAGQSHGTRSPVHPRRFGPGRWRRRAPLAGLLLPRVQADAPTRLEPAHPAEALAQLIRQAPWLMADPVAAPPVLALLSRVARLPGGRLRLGRDTYGAPAALAACLAPAVDSAAGAEKTDGADEGGNGRD